MRISDTGAHLLRAQRRTGRRLLQLRQKMLAQLAHIVLGAVDEARFAPAHEIEPEHVQARARRCRRDDAAGLLRRSTGTCSQRVVRPEARWPRSPCRCGRSPGRGPAAASSSTRVAAKRSGERQHSAPRRERSASASKVSSMRRQLEIRHGAFDCAASRRTAPCRRSMPTRRPTMFTPRSRSAFRSSVARSRRADELRRGHAPRAHQVVDRVVSLIEDAGGVQPPLDVTAAIHARHADVFADGERDRAAGSAGSHRRAASRSPTRRR